MKTALRLTMTLLLCLILILCLGSAAFAETVDFGTWGDLNWMLDDAGLLTISGEGDMNALATDHVEAWTWDRDKIHTVVIEDGVTSIGDNAFVGCLSLTDVTIPESVTSIGASGFYNCPALKGLTIPATVVSLDERAFALTGLESLVIPEGVTAIGSMAFFNCGSLTSLTIPESVAAIGDMAFMGCSALTSAGPVGSGCGFEFGWTDAIPAGAFKGLSMLESATIPEGVTAIGDMAFFGSALTDVSLPSSLKTIGSAAFIGCTGLTEIALPQGLTAVGDAAFAGCTGLTDVYYDGTETQWNAVSIGEANEPLTIATLHFREAIVSGTCGELSWTLDEEGTLTVSGVGAMDDFSRDENGVWTPDAWRSYKDAIRAVVIDEGVTSVSNLAFSECGNLESVSLPDGMTSIGFLSFFGCTKLAKLIVPASVTSIHNLAFYLSVPLKTAGPIGQGYDYEFGWTDAIPDYAFKGLAELQDVQLPDGLTDIGVNAFYDCSAIEQVTIPEGVERIGAGAFGNCAGLQRVNLPLSVTDIGKGAFVGCAALERVTIPEGLERIGELAFGYCGGLVRVDLPLSVTNIGDSAFTACTGLTDVYYDGLETQWNAITIGEGNEPLTNATIHFWEPPTGTWGDLSWTLDETRTLTISGEGEMKDFEGMFSADAWLNYKNQVLTIQIESGVTSIGNGAFNSFSNLTSVSIPESVKTIGICAFYNCKSLPDVTIPEGVETIRGQAFQNCTALRAVYLPESLTALKANAFYGCSSLTDIKIPEGVTEIWDGAFGFCTALTNVNIPKGVTQIKSGTFYFCFALQEISIPVSVTSIDSNTFVYCMGLKDVYYGGTSEQWGAITVGEGNEALTNATIHFWEPPTGTWGDLSWTLDGEGTLTISGDGAMLDYNADSPDAVKPGWLNYRESIKSVVIESGVTGIGDYAFVNCANLTSVSIPASVTRIGGGAFTRTGMTELTIPASVSEIHWNPSTSAAAFKVANGSTHFKAVDGVLYTADMAKLVAYPARRAGASFRVPDGVKVIGTYAFSNSSLQGLVLPEGVTEIEGAAFSGGNFRVPAVFFPKSLTRIGAAAFFFPPLSNGFYAGTAEEWAKVSIGEPNSINNMHYNVFPDFILPAALTAIGEEAFAGGAFTYAVLPEGVVSIGPRAFADCPNLAYIKIPASLESIDETAFEGVTGLTLFCEDDSVCFPYAMTHGYGFAMVP